MLWAPSTLSYIATNTLQRYHFSCSRNLPSTKTHTNQGDWGGFSTRINIVAKSVTSRQPSWISTGVPLLRTPSPQWATSRVVGVVWEHGRNSTNLEQLFAWYYLLSFCLVETCCSKVYRCLTAFNSNWRTLKIFGFGGAGLKDYTHYMHFGLHSIWQQSFPQLIFQEGTLPHYVCSKATFVSHRASPSSWAVARNNPSSITVFTQHMILYDILSSTCSEVMMTQHLVPAVITSKLDLLENKLHALELFQMLYYLSCWNWAREEKLQKDGFLFQQGRKYYFLACIKPPARFIWFTVC